MALHSLYCADVPLRKCSLTHSLTHSHITCSSTKKTLQIAEMTCFTDEMPLYKMFHKIGTPCLVSTTFPNGGQF